MMKNALKEIKLGFQLIPYGFQAKGNIILGIVFLVLGVLGEVLLQGESFVTGMYILLSAMMPFQLIYSVAVSDLAKITPKRKGLETNIAMSSFFIIMLMSFTIVVATKGILYAVKPENAYIYSEQLLVLAILGGFFMIYSGFGYKHFIVGTFVLVVVIMFVSFFTTASANIVLETGEDFLQLKIPFVLSIFIGYGIIIMGALLGWLLTRACYKHEMSKMAFGAALKKAMQ